MTAAAASIKEATRSSPRLRWGSSASVPDSALTFLSPSSIIFICEPILNYIEGVAHSSSSDGTPGLLPERQSSCFDSTPEPPPSSSSTFRTAPSGCRSPPDPDPMWYRPVAVSPTGSGRPGPSSSWSMRPGPPTAATPSTSPWTTSWFHSRREPVRRGGPTWSMASPAGDLLVTKHQWGAFYGTALDLQLRRRGIPDDRPRGGSRPTWGSSRRPGRRGSTATRSSSPRTRRRAGRPTCMRSPSGPSSRSSAG